MRFAAFKPEQIEVKADDPKAEVHFEAYAAIFGNRDLGGDVIHAGAFKRTLDHRLPQGLIKVFRNHREPVGMPVRMYEDSTGLYVAGRLNLDKQSGRETLSELRSGELGHMSIGYDIVRDEWDQATETLHLHEVKLLEVSPVYWPMNESASVLAVKAARDAAGMPFPSPLALGPLLSDLQRTVTDLAVRGLKTDSDRRETAHAVAQLLPLAERLKALQGDQDPAPATPADSDPPSNAAVLELDSDLDQLLGALDNLTASLGVQAAA